MPSMLTSPPSPPKRPPVSRNDGRPLTPNPSTGRKKMTDTSKQRRRASNESKMPRNYSHKMHSDDVSIGSWGGLDLDKCLGGYKCNSSIGPTRSVRSPKLSRMATTKEENEEQPVLLGKKKKSCYDDSSWCALEITWDRPQRKRASKTEATSSQKPARRSSKTQTSTRGPSKQSRTAPRAPKQKSAGEKSPNGPRTSLRKRLSGGGGKGFPTNPTSEEPSKKAERSLFSRIRPARVS